jgi:hypothetical protein
MQSGKILGPTKATQIHTFSHYACSQPRFVGGRVADEPQHSKVQHVVGQTTTLPTRIPILLRQPRFRVLHTVSQDVDLSLSSICASDYC